MRALSLRYPHHYHSVRPLAASQRLHIWPGYPSLPPSLLPYILLSHSLQHLYRQEAVSRGTNLVAYFNSLVVYTTVAVRYILGPADCPSNHLAQLKELAGRVEKEKSKVKQKGTMVCRDFKMGSSDPTDGTKNVSTVDWSFLRFEQDLRPALEQRGLQCPRLRK